MRMRMEEHDRAKRLESSEAAEQAAVEEEEGEGAAVRKEKETSAEAVLEKSKGSDR